ncbi:hypothetical protein L0156_01805 [bacterium]|nr:hypothetical protein [bacterium]
MLQNGKVLIAGGGNVSDGLHNGELFDAPIRLPKITSASTSGKKLFVTGKNFEPAAVILLNGKELKTSIDVQNPTTTLIGKKSGKGVKPGDKLQVRNLNGKLSKKFTFSN